MIYLILALIIASIIYLRLKQNTVTKNGKTLQPSEKKVEKEIEPDYNFHLKYFLDNKIGYFSFAKNKEDANFISRLVAPNGELSRWTIFRKEVLTRIPDYDIEILKCEFNSFYAMAQCYQSWKSVEKDKDILPYLKYDAIIDGETCPTCKQLHNIVLPVDDPLWDIYFPPNCSTCRCIVSQISGIDEIKLTDISKKKLKLPNDKYAINVGKHELKLSYYSNEMTERYLPEQIERTAFQALESIHIIANSKNIDTIIGRFNFLNTIYGSLIISKNNARYLTDIQYSLDKYKQLYYDKIPTDIEIHLISNPSETDLQLFYCHAIINCCKIIGLNTQEEISNLKREDAKIRRIEKFKEVIILSRQELNNHCNSTSYYTEALNVLEKLESVMTL